MYRPSQLTIDQYVSQTKADSNNHKGTNSLARLGLAALLTAAPVLNISCKCPNRPDKDQTAAYQNDNQSKYIANNERLTKEEKALAQRVYELAHSGIPKEQLSPVLDPSLAVNSKGWEKWGLGTKNLTKHEEIYASLIGYMEVISLYNAHFAKAIKTNSLTSEQKAYLRNMHGQYGKGPISANKLAGVDSASPKAAVLIALFGEELDDTKLLTRQALSNAFPENLGGIISK